PMTPAVGPTLVTDNCGAVTCVVTQFSARSPSPVVTLAQLVTGPTRSVRQTTSSVCACPGGKGASAQASRLASTVAGGCDRTYCSPRGPVSARFIWRFSPLPVLVTVTV